MKVLLVVYCIVVTVLYVLEREMHTEINDTPAVVPDADTLKAFVHRMFDEGAKEVEIKIRNPNA